MALEKNLILHASMLAFMSGAGFMLLTAIFQKAKETWRRRYDDDKKELMAEIYRRGILMDRQLAEAGPISPKSPKRFSHKSPKRLSPKSPKRRNCVSLVRSTLCQWMGYRDINHDSGDGPHVETNVNGNKLSSSRATSVVRYNSCSSQKQTSCRQTSCSRSADVSDVCHKTDDTSSGPDLRGTARRRPIASATPGRLCAKRKQKSPNRIPAHRSCQSGKFAYARDPKGGSELMRQTFQDNLCAQVVKEYPFIVPYLRENIQSRFADTCLPNKLPCLVKDRRQVAKSPPHRKRPRCTVYQHPKSARRYQSPDSSDSSLVVFCPKKKVNRLVTSVPSVKRAKTTSVNNTEPKPKKLVHTVRPNAASGSSTNSESSEKSNGPAMSQQIRRIRDSVSSSEWPESVTECLHRQFHSQVSVREESSSCRKLNQAMVIPVPALRIQTKQTSITHSFNSFEELSNIQDSGIHSIMDTTSSDHDQTRDESNHYTIPRGPKGVVANQPSGRTAKTQETSTQDMITQNVNTPIAKSEISNTQVSRMITNGLVIPATINQVSNTQVPNAQATGTEVQCGKMLNALSTSKRLHSSPRKSRPKKVKSSRSINDERDKNRLVSISHEVLNLASLQSQSPPVRELSFRQRATRRQASVFSNDSLCMSKSLENILSDSENPHTGCSVTTIDIDRELNCDSSKDLAYIPIKKRPNSQSQLLLEAFGRQHTPSGLPQLLTDKQIDDQKVLQNKTSFSDIFQTSSGNYRIINTNSSPSTQQRTNIISHCRDIPAFQNGQTNRVGLGVTPERVISRDKLQHLIFTSPRKPRISLSSPVPNMRAPARHVSLDLPRTKISKHTFESQPLTKTPKKTRSFQLPEKTQARYSGQRTTSPALRQRSNIETTSKKLKNKSNLKKNRIKDSVQDDKGQGTVIAIRFPSRETTFSLPKHPSHLASTSIKRPKPSKTKHVADYRETCELSRGTKDIAVKSSKDTFTVGSKFSTEKVKMKRTADTENVPVDMYNTSKIINRNSSPVATTQKYNKPSKISTRAKILGKKKNTNKNPHGIPRCVCLIGKSTRTETSPSMPHTIPSIKKSPIYTSRNNSHSPTIDINPAKFTSMSLDNISPIKHNHNDIGSNLNVIRDEPSIKIVYSDTTNFKSFVDNKTDVNYGSITNEDIGSSSESCDKPPSSAVSWCKTLASDAQSLEVSAEGESGLQNDRNSSDNSSQRQGKIHSSAKGDVSHSTSQRHRKTHFSAKDFGATSQKTTTAPHAEDSPPGTSLVTTMAADTPQVTNNMAHININQSDTSDMNIKHVPNTLPLLQNNDETMKTIDPKDLNLKSATAKVSRDAELAATFCNKIEETSAVTHTHSGTTQVDPVVSNSSPVTVNVLNDLHLTSKSASTSQVTAKPPRAKLWNSNATHVKHGSSKVHRKIKQPHKSQETTKCSDKQEPTKCSDKQETAKYSDKQETAKFSDKQETAKCSDKQETIKCSVKQETTKCSNKQETTKFSAKQETAKCSDKQETTKCSDKQGTTKCSDKQETSKCSDKQGTTKCSDKQGTTKCSDKQETTKCSDKQGTTKCSDTPRSPNKNTKPLFKNPTITPVDAQITAKTSSNKQSKSFCSQITTKNDSIYQTRRSDTNIRTGSRIAIHASSKHSTRRSSTQVTTESSTSVVQEQCKTLWKTSNVHSAAAESVKSPNTQSTAEESTKKTPNPESTSNEITKTPNTQSVPEEQTETVERTSSSSTLQAGYVCKDDNRFILTDRTTKYETTSLIVKNGKGASKKGTTSVSDTDHPPDNCSEKYHVTKHCDKSSIRPNACKRYERPPQFHKTYSKSRLFNENTTTVSLKIANNNKPNGNNVAKTKSASSLVSASSSLVGTTKNKRTQNPPFLSRNNEADAFGDNSTIATATISINTKNMMPLNPGSTATFTATFGTMTSSPQALRGGRASPRALRGGRVPRSGPTTLSRSSARSANSPLVLGGVRRRRRHQAIQRFSANSDSPLSLESSSEKIEISAKSDRTLATTTKQKRKHHINSADGANVSESSLAGCSSNHHAVSSMCAKSGVKLIKYSKSDSSLAVKRTHLCSSAKSESALNNQAPTACCK